MTLLAFALLPLALIGLVLLWRGLRPRRVGDTPYCRKCGYDLTGADAASLDVRCPECGRSGPLPRISVRGTRTVRKARTAVGLLLLLIGLAPCATYYVGVARGYDWYRALPVRTLLQMGKTPSEWRAWDEFERRRLAGELSKEHIDQLAAQLLTPAVFRVRPRVIDGEPTPYALTLSGGAHPYDLRFERKSLLVDGKPIDASEVGSSWPFYHAYGSWTDGVPCSGIGRHTLRLEGQFALEAGPFQPPFWTGPGVFETAFEIVPRETQTVRVVQSDDLDARMRAVNLTIRVYDWGGPDSFHISLGGDSPGIGLAFIATAESNGELVFWGELTRAVHERTNSLSDSLERSKLPVAFNPDDFTVVLRPNPEAARTTADIEEIWGGELRFDHVSLPQSTGCTANSAPYAPTAVLSAPQDLCGSLSTDALLEQLDTPSAKPAWAELERRRLAGRLSHPERTRLVERILKSAKLEVRRVLEGDPTPFRAVLDESVPACYELRFKRVDRQRERELAAAREAEEQRWRAATQAAAAAQAAREAEEQGWQTATQPWGIDVGTYVHITVVPGEASTGCWMNDFEDYETRYFGRPNWPSRKWCETVQCAGLGRHTLEIEGNAELRKQGNIPDVLWTGPLSFTGTCEVVPADTPVVDTVRSAELDAWLLEHVKLADLAFEGDQKCLRFDLYADAPPPVDLVFEAVAEYAGGQSAELSPKRAAFECGVLRTKSRTLEPGCEIALTIRDEFDPHTLQIRLRASPRIARQTADIVLVWGGELIFGPFDPAGSSGDFSFMTKPPSQQTGLPPLPSFIHSPRIEP